MRSLKRFLAALIVAIAMLLGPLAPADPAHSASTCDDLRTDILAESNASGFYGEPVPNLCTKDCPSIYDYYLNFPAINNHDALAYRVMQVYNSCNVTQVPSSGLPVSGTYLAPDRKLKPCPKITKDMHGRTDFARTNCLSRRSLAGFNLSGMDLTGAGLRGTILTGANLSGAKLNSADLSGAVLDFANIAGADFSSTKFDDVRAAHTNGTPRYLSYSFKLINGFLLGPRVDLSRVWLKGATLTNLDLSYANLTATVLDNAKLTNIRVYQAKFTPSVQGAVTYGLQGKPATWNVTIIKGYLIAPGVNLSGANLSYSRLDGLKLIGCDLTRADLRHATATRADFSKATLYSANLGDADFTGARFGGVRSNTFVYGVPKALPMGWYLGGNYLKRG